MDREPLAVGQIHAEQEADQRDREADDPTELAADRQRPEDADVASEAQNRDRDPVELRVAERLDRLAAAAREAQDLDLVVVRIGQVAGDANADQRQDQDRDPQTAVGAGIGRATAGLLAVTVLMKPA